jgi:hypothetical protein
MTLHIAHNGVMISLLNASVTTATNGDAPEPSLIHRNASVMFHN